MNNPDEWWAEFVADLKAAADEMLAEIVAEREPCCESAKLLRPVLSQMEWERTKAECQCHR